jgi:acetyltransferase-like isoleucine patch superfamily enzyme
LSARVVELAKRRLGNLLREFGFRSRSGWRFHTSRRIRGMLWRSRFASRGRRLQLGPRVRLPRPPAGATIAVGDDVRLERGVEVWFEGDDARIWIGDRTYLHRDTHLRCATAITIGSDCAISWQVQIMDTDYHSIDGGSVTSPVAIGDHVWIGAGAKILRGVSIGNGAVVAAGAVVTRDVPDRALVGGVPAAVLKTGVTWA